MKIFIAIPTQNGTVTAEIAQLLFRLARYTEEKNGLAFSCYLLGGIQPRDYARNLLAKEFLASDADYLWWIDADMAPNGSVASLFAALTRNDDFETPWPKDAPERTFYDIFTCYTLCITNQKPGMAMPLVPPAFKKEIPGSMQMEIELGLQECALVACGFGCTILSRRVVEDKSLWADEALDREGIPGVFRDTQEPSGRCKQSEDTHFTQRASKAGYKILYVPQAVVGHYKTQNLVEIAGMGTACFNEGLKRGGEGWKQQ